MARLAVAAVVVIGLALGVWWLWPPDDQPGPSTTLPSANPTTTSTTPDPTSTTLAPDSHVVETVEEAETILRDLWLGWFEGIYLQDEDRIREVVATEEQVDTAREQFGVMEFTSPPTPEGLQFEDTEILRSDKECLALWTAADPNEFLGPGDLREGVDVLRWIDGRWMLLSSWRFRGDMWETDCESSLP